MQNNNIVNWGPYILENNIEQSFCKKLLDEGKKLGLENNFNSKLASKIKDTKSFSNKEWMLEPLIPYVNEWIKGWNLYGKNKFQPSKASLNNVWINFQRKKEYNPIHMHSGSDLSFVVYLKVPDELIEEHNNSINKDRSTPPGVIEFIYGQANSFFVSGHNIFPKENTIIMFPSELMHWVPHFESDVERISVAGNIKFN